MLLGRVWLEIRLACELSSSVVGWGRMRRELAMAAKLISGDARDIFDFELWWLFEYMVWVARRVEAAEV